MASENAASVATAAPDRPDQPRHGKRGAPQAFARKLAEILRDEEEAVISWNDAGTAFMVQDVERFSQDVLVKHYRYAPPRTSTPVAEVFLSWPGRGSALHHSALAFLFSRSLALFPTGPRRVPVSQKKTKFFFKD